MNVDFPTFSSEPPAEYLPNLKLITNQRIFVSLSKCAGHGAVPGAGVCEAAGWDQVASGFGAGVQGQVVKLK
jgi:hypothetical protein